ncbi:MAG: serine hydrolase [Pseudomonadota bacterium]
MLTRRAMLASALLPLAAPALGQSAGFEASAASLGDRLHSLIVQQNGQEVFARAYGGRGLDRVANVKSVSKTLLALMTGIAIDRGVIAGADAPVLPLLGRAPTGDARDAITVGHLLSMQTGLASTSGPNYGAWVSSRDWVASALAQEIESTPGGDFIYSTGGWHILGAALSRQADASLLELARTWLGRPLGVDFAPWVQDPQGRYLGGNDMALSPRDLLRIGQMVLDGGQWDGAQVVPAGWLSESWQPRARSPWSGDQYGYGWFLTRLGGTDVAYGRGFGGQMLAVAPERRVVIAITSDPTRPARSRGYFGTLQSLVADILRDVA